MESLVKTVAQILDTYFRDNIGNRENQWSFGSLKNVILNEIRDYKVNEKKPEADTGKPVEKETVKEDKK